MYFAKLASYSPSWISFQIFCTLSDTLVTFEANLSMAEEESLLSKGESVLPGLNEIVKSLN